MTKCENTTKNLNVKDVTWLWKASFYFFVVNPLHAIGLFWYLLKTSEKQKGFWCFPGVSKLAWTSAGVKFDETEPFRSNTITPLHDGTNIMECNSSLRNLEPKT